MLNSTSAVMATPLAEHAADADAGALACCVWSSTSDPADPSLDMLANNAFSLVAPAPLDAAMGALNLGGGVPVAPAPQQSDSEDDGAAVAPEELEGDGEGRGDDDDDVGSNNDDEAADGGGAFVF